MAQCADIISIRALLAQSVEGELQRQIAAADIIVAMDVMTRREKLVFGHDHFCRTASGQPVGVVRVALDMGTDEMERLGAVIEALKRHHRQP